MSVRLKGRNMVLLECWILGILAQIAVADRKDIQLASHEAAEPVLWLTDDRLAPHVETGVDQDRTPGQALESSHSGLKEQTLNPPRASPGPSRAPAKRRIQPTATD